MKDPKFCPKCGSNNIKKDVHPNTNAEPIVCSDYSGDREYYDDVTEHKCDDCRITFYTSK